MSLLHDPALITAYAALIGAFAAVIGAFGTLWVGLSTLGNRKIGERAIAASVANSAAIKAVDTKVEAVAEQTNGHMTSLIAAVAPIDPGLATAAAVTIVKNAETVAEKLKASVPCDKPK